MSSLEIRAEQVRKMIDDPLISSRESLKFALRWVRFEYLMMRRDRIQIKCDFHSAKLKEEIHVFNARHEMEKHL